jgi:Kef-type K+ transport system membrane component KefB/mannitol/fructose-specific phosphotransferase system IIA component
MAVFPNADPLLILAAIIVAGMGLGWMAGWLRLPAVTGQIVAGVLIGPAGLALFEAQSVQGLQPLTHFALALIGVTVGAHLNVRRLRNAGRRLLLLLVAEATLTPLAVGLALILLADVGLTLGALLGTLAISTAPATIVALVRETRSRGVFVKTLLGAVAMNNMSCIVLFELARSAARFGVLPDPRLSSALSVPITQALLESLYPLGLAIAVGAGAAILTHLLTLRVVRPDRLATISVISILLTFGLASYVALSPLLACMALGIVLSNLNPARDRLVDYVFTNFEPAIMCVFFTVAGMHLSFEHAAQAGWVALIFFAFRIAGKLVSANLSMRLAGATERVRRCLGMALIPQAGIAVGLVILIEDDPAFAPIHALFVAVVLTAVTLNEILGPIATRIALARVGEVGRDRPRLVDFLQEENITTDLEADTMEEAIEKLTNLLITSHHLDHVDRKALLESTLERERQVSTCLEGGLAVPHGELPEGTPMVGVMGISRRGLHVETPDGRPLHCVVLLATPRGERERHLAVLAALARTVGADPVIQQQLYSAKSPAHVCEILHGEETEDFNYFLEDQEQSGF